MRITIFTAIIFVAGCSYVTKSQAGRLRTTLKHNLIYYYHLPEGEKKVLQHRIKETETAIELINTRIGSENNAKKDTKWTEIFR